LLRDHCNIMRKSLYAFNGQHDLALSVEGYRRVAEPDATMHDQIAMLA
jgi:hypothetical protein